MKNFQLTLGAAATPLIAAGLPNAYASWLVIQNNAANDARMGGAGVTSSTGILIAKSGSATGLFDFPRGACLNNIFMAGTQGNVIDICYEDSE